MSWQAGTLAVVLLMTGAGMLWYERSRPPSQIVALVAVLAALAVAGRIVLAPIPNVVATTDIVLFSGFALGPAPGFAVGALGGLVSNFWLGQGVWTPWQMVGWGMTGVAGGVLWKLTRGNANRWTLAAACGTAGLAFGLWMNFQTMVSFGGEMSLDRYLALEARAVPFDMAHIIGNIVFALAAGPAMVAALRRFRERFEWRQATGLAGALLVVVAVGTITFAPPAKAEPGPAATRAAAWLKGQQNPDGGFPPSPESESSVSITARAMLGLTAAGVNPLDVRSGGSTPLVFIRARRQEIADANEIALVILALDTVGGNPRDFEGRNLVEALIKRRGADASFGNKVNVAAFAVLAFRSAGAQAAARETAGWLRTAQNRKGSDSGGWGIADGARSDPDSTGTVLQVVGDSDAVASAIRYLNRTQQTSGGFATGGVVNSQSTGLVLQGLAARGRFPAAIRNNGNNGLDYLRSRQQADGSIWYSRTSDQTRVWVTADALVALSGAALPVGEAPRSPAPPPSPQPDYGGSNGGFVPDLSGGSSPSSGTGVPNPDATANNIPGDGVNPQPDPVPPAGTAPALEPSPLETVVPPIPVIPSADLLAASQAGPSPSPVLAILIALLVWGGLAGGTVLLVRHNGW